MKYGSLFGGIGGFDLAAEWVGWENVFHCEWNNFARKVLGYYWPDSISYYDIKETDFTPWRGKVDIISGGFPCQPYSTAGKRLGTEDDRHLWPEMLRAVREAAPRWVVGENVRGLLNWNGGLVFDEVQADLEAAGYEVIPFLLPACAVNAPHRRDRIWFVAYAGSDGHERRGFGENRQKESKSKSQGDKRERVWDNNRGAGESGASTNTKSMRSTEQHSPKNPGQQVQTRRHTNGQNGKGASPDPDSNQRPKRGMHPPGPETTERHFSPFVTRGEREDWRDFPTQPPICGGNDGLPRELDGITFPKWRNESLKAYGNAIVPQVALQIFKAIHDYENA